MIELQQKIDDSEQRLAALELRVGAGEPPPLRLAANDACDFCAPAAHWRVLARVQGAGARQLLWSAT